MDESPPTVETLASLHWEDAFTEYEKTVQILLDVKGYLERLPILPVTRDLCLQIESHLASLVEIKNSSTEERLKRQQQRTLIGGAYTVSGVAMIEATYVDRRLQLLTPASPLFDARHARSLVNRLHRGLKLDLHLPLQSESFD